MPSPIAQRPSPPLPQSRRRGLLDISYLAPRTYGPRGGDRGFIAGRSGSGKSYLANELLSVYHPPLAKPSAPFAAWLVIADPNHTFEWPGAHIVDDPGDVRPNKSRPVIQYRPGNGGLEADAWNEFFAQCFHTKGPVLAYIDEALAMEPLFGVRRIAGGNWLTAYLTRGRAHHKAALMVSQQPVSIPRTMIRNSEFFYMFDLPIEDDRIVMAGVMGREAADGADLRDRDALGRYEFWFRGPEDRKPLRLRVMG